MDFAENFTCTSADEVQSAYWNSAVVTLHPVVVYFKKEESLKHKNYVIVSDDNGHNIGLVYAILKELVPKIKEDVDLEKIYYWTDSPSSQYRNKSAFFIISDHSNLLGTQAEWNYFECGHGKGPCDGIGGTAKRTAAMAVKQGKCIIQDATDFYKNVPRFHQSASYMFVSTGKAETAREDIRKMNNDIMPLKGTMQMHHVKGIETGTVLAATTSCYCSQCLQGVIHYGSETNIMKKDTAIANSESPSKPSSPSKTTNPSKPNSPTKTASPSKIRTSPSKSTNFQILDWVAVTYENQWYVGQITDFDKEDSEYEIKFLQKTDDRTTKYPTFKWPSKDDILDITMDQIICKVDQPELFGRSGRCFVLKEEDYKNILQKIP